MQTVKYLQQHGLTKTVEDFRLLHKRHNTFPNLVLLKYDAIESPMGESVSQECRSLIVDENNNWKPVAYPYMKFFNLGEGHAAKIDWDTAQVFEKLDGSIITLYFYNNTWHISTSGVPDASAPLNDTGVTFADMFWKVWQRLGYSLPNETQYCYMFELMTPFNRVVVQHSKSNIVLHGVRDMSTLKEYNPNFFAQKNNWECVKVFHLNNFDAVVNAANVLNPVESEGFIVCDGNFNRVKIKSPQYVALHHLKGTMSVRRMIEIILANENSEFLTYFPEFQPLYDVIKEKFDDLINRILVVYSENKHLEDRKSFALKVKDYEFAFACFSLYNTKPTDEKVELRRVLSGCNIRHIESILQVDNLNLISNMD